MSEFFTFVSEAPWVFLVAGFAVAYTTMDFCFGLLNWILRCANGTVERAFAKSEKR